MRLRGTKRRGTAAVEFAIAATGLVTLVLGTFEVGRIVEVQQILAASVAQGGRTAAAGNLTNAQIQSVVKNYLSAAGLPIQNVTVTVQDITSPGTDVSSATQLDQLQVSVSIPYQDVQWSTTTLFTNSVTQLTAQSTWYSAKVQAYPSNITVPPAY